MGHLVKLIYPEAPSGTFVATNHGTNTAAALYSDFECTAADPTRTLNAAGRFTCYITDRVDFTVYNAAGVQVDAITEGVAAELVSVTNANWTGTLPNGTQGAGGELPLDTLLNNLAASFGSTNGYVKETDQATSKLLKDALKDIRSANFPYFNVKSAPYNAAGDGVTDDTAAIQAAINAAAAAGGGVVFFPASSSLYMVSSTLSITHAKVSILGDGHAVSTIRYTPATGYCISVNVGGSTNSYIRNLGINILNPGGGALTIASSAGFSIENNKIFAQSAGDNPAMIRFQSNVRFSANVVEAGMGTSTGRGVIEIDGAVNGFFVENTFTAMAANFSAGMPNANSFIRIPAASGTAGTFVLVGNRSGADGLSWLIVTATGASFVVVGNAAQSPIGILTAAASAYVSEYGNLGALITEADLTGQAWSGSRESRFVNHGNIAGGGTLTVGVGARTHIATVTGATSTIADAGFAYESAELLFRIRNTSGGAHTFTWGAGGYLGAGGMGTLANGATRVVRFIRAVVAVNGWRYDGHWDTT